MAIPSVGALLWDAVLFAATTALGMMKHTEGPRLQDTKGTVADYGTPLNYLYGTRKLGTVCFFCEDIKEVKKTRKGKGGKQTEYTYFGTFAVAVADHEITSINKVWFDQHLVYDASATTTTFPLGDGYSLTSSMRFYTGTEDQDPDPRMLATVETLHGAGTCPAYRGVSYIMFEDIPLEKLGNRYPQVTVEAATVSASGAAVVIDFEHGVYTIGGASQALGDVLVANTASDWSSNDFSATDIVSGSGLTVDTTAAYAGRSAFDLTPAAFAAATAGDPMAGFTANITFSVSGVDVPLTSIDLTGFFADLIMFDTGAVNCWYNEAGWQKYGSTQTNTSFVLSAAPSTEIPLDMASGDGDHVAVFGFMSSGLTGQIDGGTVATIASPATFTATTIRFEASMRAGGVTPTSQQMVVKKLEFTPTGGGGTPGVVTLGDIAADIADRSGLSTSDYDFADLDQVITGYSWTQGTGKQICEPLLNLYDSDIRPHDFSLDGLKRTGTSGGSIATDELVASNDRYKLTVANDTDLPRRVFFTFADTDADQQPNSAVAQRSASSVDSSREQSLDMSTLALDITTAKQLVDRTFRRTWFARKTAELSLTRRHLEVEPGDVRTFDLDGEALTARCTRMTIGADGTLSTEWAQDDEAIPGLSGAPGAPAVGIAPAVMFDPVATAGYVLDLPLLSDAHDQTTPFIYLTAGPAAVGTWTGADYSQSASGETGTYLSGWDAVTSTEAAITGTATALGNVQADVLDRGSSITVTLNSGTLTSVTEADILNDGTINLALIGDEIVQFTTATLTGTLTYTVTGFVRGARGTEWAISGHSGSERFVLLSDAKKHTMGAGEIGGTGHYIVTSLGLGPNEADAFTVTFAANAHKPYAPAHGTATLSGGDWLINAVRRTRIGGATLNGSDVPLGESSESWQADIMDGATVRRTLTGTSLPLTYTAAQQTTDWGGGQTTLEVNLYQVDPTLSLRGFPLNITG